MDRRRRRIRGMLLGGLAWIWLGAGLAQAGTIPPTNPTTRMLEVGAPVSVSLYQLDSTLPMTVTLSSPSRCASTGTLYYRDVTDCWLPEVGKSVFVVINGPAATPTLVLPAAPPPLPLAPGTLNPWVTALTTSAYPGQYINVGSETGADAVLASAPTSLPTSATTSVMGWQLTPQDGGMMAVIQIGPHQVIVPQDGTATGAANGIPEIWEALYGGNLNPESDLDVGPAANSALGDGLSTFDEYRGALVDGRQVRLDPLLKDVILFIVTGQCPTATSPTSLLLAGGYPTPTSPNASLTLGSPATLGSVTTLTASTAVFSAANVRGEITGNAGGRARVLRFTNATSVVAEITEVFPTASILAGSWKVSESLLANLYTLFSPERVRLLGAPGSRNSAEWVDTFVSYSDLTGRVTYTAAGSGSDRVVNANRLYGPAQKGVRCIECLDDSTLSPYGYALGGIGSPNEIGNVIYYSMRVKKHLTQVINSGAPRKVQYSPMLTPVLKSGKVNDWNPKTLVPDGDPSTTTGDGDPANLDVKDFIISRAGQFYVGHEVGHSLDLNGLASSAPHFPAFSGDMLDTSMVSKLTGTGASGRNTFYIPSGFGISDQSAIQIE